jgi:hypothetical protein
MPAKSGPEQAGEGAQTETIKFYGINGFIHLFEHDFKVILNTASVQFFIALLFTKKRANKYIYREDGKALGISQ